MQIDTVSVDRQHILTLEVTARLAPLVHHKGLHPAWLGELVRRAVASGRFKIADDGTFRDTQTPAEWLDDLEQSGEAREIFESAKHAAPRSNSGKEICGFPESEFLKLSPERRLALANEMKAKRRVS